MMRALLSLMLAMMLALTSQSMAVARGASAATGQMVICTGVGATLVYMDATGAPTSAPHICPDATVGAVLSEAIRPPVQPEHLLRFAYAKQAATFPPRAHRQPGPPSRAPPLTV